MFQPNDQSRKLVDIMSKSYRTPQDLDLIRSYLSKIKFFEEQFQMFRYAPESILQICQKIKYQSHPQWSIVFRQGDRNCSRAYIILSGRVSVCISQNQTMVTQKSQKINNDSHLEQQQDNENEAENQSVANDKLSRMSSMRSLCSPAGSQRAIQIPIQQAREQEFLNPFEDLLPNEREHQEHYYMLNKLEEIYGKIVIDLGVGALFGQRALIEQTNRAATICTQTFSQFLTLQQNDFQLLMNNVKKLQSNRKQLINQQFPFIIKDVSNWTIMETYYRSFQDEFYNLNQIVLQENVFIDPNKAKIYIIIDGEFTIEQQTLINKNSLLNTGVQGSLDRDTNELKPNKKSTVSTYMKPNFSQIIIKLATLCYGETFGEDCLDTSSSYYYSVICSSDRARVLSIDRNNFVNQFPQEVKQSFIDRFRTKFNQRKSKFKQLADTVEKNKKQNLNSVIEQIKLPIQFVNSLNNSENSTSSNINSPINIGSKQSIFSNSRSPTERSEPQQSPTSKFQSPSNIPVLRFPDRLNNLNNKADPSRQSPIQQIPVKNHLFRALGNTEVIQTAQQSLKGQNTGSKQINGQKLPIINRNISNNQSQSPVAQARQVNQNSGETRQSLAQNQKNQFFFAKSQSPQKNTKQTSEKSFQETSKMFLQTLHSDASFFPHSQLLAAVDFPGTSNALNYPGFQFKNDNFNLISTVQKNLDKNKHFQTPKSQNQAIDKALKDIYTLKAEQQKKKKNLIGLNQEQNFLGRGGMFDNQNKLQQIDTSISKNEQSFEANNKLLKVINRQGQLKLKKTEMVEKVITDQQYEQKSSIETMKDINPLTSKIDPYPFESFNRQITQKYNRFKSSNGKSVMKKEDQSFHSLRNVDSRNSSTSSKNSTLSNLNLDDSRIGINSLLQKVSQNRQQRDMVDIMLLQNQFQSTTNLNHKNNSKFQPPSQSQSSHSNKPQYSMSPPSKLSQNQKAAVSFSSIKGLVVQGEQSKQERVQVVDAHQFAAQKTSNASKIQSSSLSNSPVRKFDGCRDIQVINSNPKRR